MTERLAQGIKLPASEQKRSAASIPLRFAWFSEALSFPTRPFNAIISIRDDWYYLGISSAVWSSLKRSLTGLFTVVRRMALTGPRTSRFVRRLDESVIRFGQ